MFRQVFDWLLNKGVATAMLILNGIFYAVLAVAMAILHWYNKNH